MTDMLYFTQLYTPLNLSPECLAKLCPNLVISSSESLQPFITSGIYLIIYSVCRLPGHQLYRYGRCVMNMIKQAYVLLQLHRLHNNSEW